MSELSDYFRKLKNGAYVVASRPSTFWDNCEIVLCLWDISGEVQWVTWLNHTENGTSWGHYFDRTELAAAARDFADRK